MQDRLYRSRYNRIVGGVCGGLGQYLGVDATLLRVMFLISIFIGGSGVLAYLLMLLVVPVDIEEAPPDETASAPGFHAGVRASDEGRPRHSAALVGGFLVLVGGIVLFQNMGLSLFHWFDAGDMWPLLLIVVGVLLLKSKRHPH